MASVRIVLMHSWSIALPVDLATLGTGDAVDSMEAMAFYDSDKVQQYSAAINLRDHLGIP